MSLKTELFECSRSRGAPQIALAEKTCGNYWLSFGMCLTDSIQSQIYSQLPIPKAQFGGRFSVTMLPGGGIGPELMAHVREVFKVVGVPVDFEVIDIDPSSEGNDDLEYAIMSIKRNGVAIKGSFPQQGSPTGLLPKPFRLQETSKRKVKRPKPSPEMLL